MGARGRGASRERFSCGVLIDRTLAVYERCSCGRGGDARGAAVAAASRPRSPSRSCSSSPGRRGARPRSASRPRSLRPSLASLAVARRGRAARRTRGPPPAAPPHPRPVPRRGRPHQRRRGELLRLRPVAGEGRRPRLHQRVHPLRPHRRATTSRCPTRTGLRRSIFAVGPALVWMPFFAAGRGRRAARRRLLGAARRPLGVRPVPRQRGRAGQPAPRVRGRAAHPRRAARGTSTPASPCSPRPRSWLATFLYWYMVQQPTMSHAPSVFGAALVVWLWDRRPRAPDARRLPAPRPRARAGHVPALAERACSAAARRSTSRRRARRGGLRRAVARRGRARRRARSLGAFPQMAAWHVLYGEWVLLDPPHGADFLRLGRPFVLETLFSSRHGLLSWTPVLWLGYLGFWPLLRTRRALALPLLLPAAVMTYVNMCSGDWWAGGSFSNRRFDSLLPVLALRPRGLHRMAGAARSRGRPALVPAALAVAAGALNVAMLEGVRAAERPRARSPSPTPWAAARSGWRTPWAVLPPGPRAGLFAWRHRLPPGQYDLLVGRYLFYRQNNLQGRIDLGAPGDEAMLGEGWGAARDARRSGGAAARTGAARILAPARRPRGHRRRGARPRRRARRRVRVEVNGRDAGRASPPARRGASIALAVGRGPLAARPQRRRARAAGRAAVWIDAVDFLRAGVPEGAGAGVPRPVSRRVVVIGGGPAGLKAAHDGGEGRRSRHPPGERAHPRRPGQLLRRPGHAHRALLPLHLQGRRRPAGHPRRAGALRSPPLARLADGVLRRRRALSVPDPAGAAALRAPRADRPPARRARR